MNKPFKRLNERDPEEVWFTIGDEVEIMQLDDDEWEPAGKVIKIARPINCDIRYWVDNPRYSNDYGWPLHRVRPAGCRLGMMDNFK